MNKSEAHELAIKSAQDEIKAINSCIEKACINSDLSVQLESISDAAKSYFTEQGFTIIQMCFEGTNKTVNITSTTIRWE